MNPVQPIFGGSSFRSIFTSVGSVRRAASELAQQAWRHEWIERSSSWIHPMFSLGVLTTEPLYGSALGMIVSLLSAARNPSLPNRSLRRTVRHETAGQFTPTEPGVASTFHKDRMAATALPPVMRSGSASTPRTARNGSPGHGFVPFEPAAPVKTHKSVVTGSNGSVTAETTEIVTQPITSEPHTGSPWAATARAPIPGVAVAMLREHWAKRVAMLLTSLRNSGDHALVARALIEQWSSVLTGPGASEELLLEASSASLAAPVAGVSAAAPTTVFTSVVSEAGSESATGSLAMVVAGTGSTELIDFPSPRAAPPEPVFAPTATLTEEIFFRSNDLIEWGNSAGSPRARTSVSTAATPVGASGGEFQSLEQRDLETGEDLAILSTKVKRILDEEARRYGIEV